MTSVRKGTSSEKYQEILQKLVQDEMQKQNSRPSPNLATLLVTLQNTTMYSGVSAFESTEQGKEQSPKQEDEKLDERMTVQQLKRYITSVLGRPSCSSAEQREIQTSALAINKMFFDKVTRRKVRIYDPVLGEYEKDMSLQELLEDIIRTDDPWMTLAQTAQHWARGQAAILKCITEAEFDQIMGKVDSLDLDAHSSDEELDEEGKSVAQRARRRFRTGKANLQRAELAAAKRLRVQAQKQKAELDAMRTKANMLKKVVKDLRSSDPVAVSEANRQAAEIEATMKSLERLLKQTQQKASAAAISAIQENDLDVYARSNGFDAAHIRRSRCLANTNGNMLTGIAPIGAAVVGNNGATYDDGHSTDGRQMITGVVEGSEYIGGLGGGYVKSELRGGEGAGVMRFNVEAAKSYAHLDLSDAATQEKERDDARGGRMRMTQQAAQNYSHLDLSEGANKETTSSSRDARGDQWRSGPLVEVDDNKLLMKSNGPGRDDEGTSSTCAGSRMRGGHQTLKAHSSLPNIHDPYDSSETGYRHKSAAYGNCKRNNVKARNTMNTETYEADPYQEHHQQHHQQIYLEGDWKYSGQGALSPAKTTSEHPSPDHGKDGASADNVRWQIGSAPDLRNNAQGIDTGGGEEEKSASFQGPGWKPYGGMNYNMDAYRSYRSDDPYVDGIKTHTKRNSLPALKNTERGGRRRSMSCNDLSSMYESEDDASAKHVDRRPGHVVPVDEQLAQHVQRLRRNRAKPATNAASARFILPAMEEEPHATPSYSTITFNFGSQPTSAQKPILSPIRRLRLNSEVNSSLRAEASDITSMRTQDKEGACQDGLKPQASEASLTHLTLEDALNNISTISPEPMTHSRHNLLPSMKKRIGFHSLSQAAKKVETHDQ